MEDYSMRLPKKGLIGLFAVLLLLGQQAPAQDANPVNTPEKTETHRPMTLGDGNNTKKVVLILATAVILACIAAKIYSSFTQVPEAEESIEEFFNKNSLSMEKALEYSENNE